MHVDIEGKPTFASLHVSLDPGETIVSEAGAMASMGSEVGHALSSRGSVFSALKRGLLAGENPFFSLFSNKGVEPCSLVLAPREPGDINEITLEDETIYLQSRSFIACTEGVKISASWAGFNSLGAGEGLFRIRAKGTGKLWQGCYGAILAHDLDGEYIVDSSHVAAYPEGVKLKLKLAGGGVFASMASGEGVVARLEGKGRIYIQTRSLSGLGGWVNRMF